VAQTSRIVRCLWFLTSAGHSVTDYRWMRQTGRQWVIRGLIEIIRSAYARTNSVIPAKAGIQAVFATNWKSLPRASWRPDRFSIGRNDGRGLSCESLLQNHECYFSLWLDSRVRGNDGLLTQPTGVVHLQQFSLPCVETHFSST
jgi:hypothetical protein